MKLASCLVLIAACGNDPPPERPKLPKPALSVVVRHRAKAATIFVTTVPNGNVRYYRKGDEKSMKAVAADANGKATVSIPEEEYAKETIGIVDVEAVGPLPDGVYFQPTSFVEVKWNNDDPIAPFHLAVPSGATGVRPWLFGRLKNGTDEAQICKPIDETCDGRIAKDGKLSVDIVDATAKTIVVDGKPQLIAGGRAHVELDLGERIATTDFKDVNSHVRIPVEITDEEGHWTGEMFPINTASMAELLLDLKTDGPHPLPGDPPAPPKPRTAILGIGEVIGPGTRAIDIDALVAISEGAKHTFGTCRYEQGRNITREATDTVIAIKDRRTGKLLVTHTESARVEACPTSVMSSSAAWMTMNAKVSRKAALDWVAAWLAK